MVGKAPHGQYAMVGPDKEDGRWNFAPNVGAPAALGPWNVHLAVKQGLAHRLGTSHHLALQPLHSGRCRMLAH